MFYRIHKEMTSRRSWGGLLREARIRARKTIEDASSALKIQPNYLSALESMHVEELPGKVYARHFLIRYARWVDVDLQKILPLFDTSLSEELERHALLVPRVSSGDLRVWTRIVRWSLAACFLASSVLYFGYHIWSMMLPPVLSLTYPSEDLHLSEMTLQIAGMTDPEAQVMVNGENIQTDPSGRFEKMLILQQGVNEIQVSARSKYSRPAVIVRHVVVEGSHTVFSFSQEGKEERGGIFSVLGFDKDAAG